MKRGLFAMIGLILFSITITTAQVQNLKLVQTKGEFDTKSMVITPGEYQFEIFNEGVSHEVGFVLVPEGKYDEANHIKNAYVKSLVAEGKSSSTDVVTLVSGSYEYFCPLNPTPKYKITVLDDVETIKLGQVPGSFKVKAMTVEPGNYQFEIANNGVDHEVGFVLVPAGKYDASDHIKEAYVKQPVKNGSSSLTGIINLESGIYEYFCPLNPTDKYSITVE